MPAPARLPGLSAVASLVLLLPSVCAAQNTDLDAPRTMIEGTAGEIATPAAGGTAVGLVLSRSLNRVSSDTNARWTALGIVALARPGDSCAGLALTGDVELVLWRLSLRLGLGPFELNRIDRRGVNPMAGLLWRGGWGFRPFRDPRREIVLGFLFGGGVSLRGDPPSDEFPPDGIAVMTLGYEAAW